MEISGRKLFILRAAITIFLLSFCSPANSQFINKYGLKAGLNFSGLHSSAELDYLATDATTINFRLLSFDVALYAEVLDSRHFCVSTELHYYIKGDSRDNPFTIFNLTPGGSGTYSYGEVSERFSYLSFQLLPHWKFIATHDDRVYLLAGPAFDYRISTWKSEGPEDYKINTGKVEFALVFGLGGEIGELFNYEVRYQHNLSNVYKITYGDEVVNRSLSSFHVLLGVSLKKLYGLVI
jgi:hypothetical protein